MHPDVRAELKLTDAQVARLREEIRPPMPPQGGPRPPRDGEGRPPREREEIEAKIREILDPRQYARYREISLQVAGPGAVLRPEVGAELRLSQGQRERIQEILEQNRPPRPPMPPEIGSGSPPEPPQPARPPSAEDRRRVMDQVLRVLNDGQRARLREMMGKPFELRPPTRHRD